MQLVHVTFTNSIAVERQLVATDNDSTLDYIEGESDYTTWPGNCRLLSKHL